MARHECLDVTVLRDGPGQVLSDRLVEQRFGRRAALDRKCPHGQSLARPPSTEGRAGARTHSVRQVQYSRSRSANSTGRLSATRWPPGMMSGVMPRRSWLTRIWKSAGKKRSSAPAITRGRHVGPPVDGEWLSKRRVRLSRFGLGHHRVEHVRWYVVEEVGERVVRHGTPLLRSESLAGLGLPGGTPPVAGGLAGKGDHRIDHHQHLGRSLRAHQRSGEPAHRLGDDDDRCRDVVDRIEHRRRVLGQAGGLVAGRQFDGDAGVTASIELGDESIPVERAAAGTGDEHERGARVDGHGRTSSVGRSDR